MKKVMRILYILLAVALCVTAAVVLFNLGLIGGMDATLPEMTYASAQPVGEEIACGKAGTDEFELLAQQGGLSLYLRTSDANFYVQTPSGECWYAFPAEGADDWARGVYKTEMVSTLIIKYVDLEENELVKKNSQAASVKKDTFTLHRLENGFRADYTFKDGAVTIPVEVTLTAGHLNVRIVTGEIVEETPAQYILSSIALLPNFGGATAEDAGYVFVPDGQGALMYFGMGKENRESYMAAVYGEHASATRLFATARQYQVTMPVYGVKRNASAFLTVITGGENAAYINAVPNYQNTSYANVWTEYKLRFTDSYVLDASSGTGQTITLYQDGAVETAACEQRYYFLEDEQADYSGMAAQYREYLLTEAGVTACEKDDTVLMLDVYAAVVREENVLGVPVERQRQLSALADVTALYEQLKASSEGGIRLRMNSWSKDALKGKLDTKQNWAAGNGWTGWTALQTAMAANGDDASLTVALTSYQKSGNGIVAIRDSAMALSGSPAFQYAFKLSTNMRDEEGRGYLLHPALLESTAQRALTVLEEQGVASLSLTGLTETRYGSYGQNSAYPEQTQEAIVQLLASLTERYRLTADAPNAYALAYVDFVVDAPLGSSQWDVLDETVPFVQMVYGGLVGYAGETVNLSADPEGAVLHAIATGEALHYELMTGDVELLIDTELNRLFSARSDLWAPKIEAAVAQLEAARAVTENSRLVDFEWIGEEVSVSVFENGAVLCVNAGKTDAMWGDTVVPAGTWMSGKEAAQ